MVTSVVVVAAAVVVVVGGIVVVGGRVVVVVDVTDEEIDEPRSVVDVLVDVGNEPGKPLVTVIPKTESPGAGWVLIGGRVPV